MNVLAYLNSSAASLYEDPNNLRLLFICLSVLLALEFLTSFYLASTLTSNIGFLNVFSLWKKNKKPTTKIEQRLHLTIASIIQFISALLLWAGGIAAMLYGKSQHLSFTTFITASWVGVPSITFKFDTVKIIDFI